MTAKKFGCIVLWVLTEQYSVKMATKTQVCRENN